MSTAREDGFRSSGSFARRTHVVRALFPAFAAAIDALVVLGASVATGVGYHRTLYGEAGPLIDFVTVGLLAAWLFLVPSIMRGEYSSMHYLQFRRHTWRIIHHWTFTSVCLVTLGFLTKTSFEYSRGWAILFYFAGIVTLLLAHAGLVRAVQVAHRHGLLATKRLLLVGAEEEISGFVHRYRPWRFGLDIVGVSPICVGRSGHEARPLTQVGKELEAAVATARVLRPDSIFILVSWSQQDLIERCIEAFMTVPASIHLGPERILDRFENIGIEKIGPLASLHLLRPPLSAGSILAKRAFDLAAAAGALILLLPLFFLVALLIKLDSPGPVFFFQWRYGFNQKAFRIIKLRTMMAMEDGAEVRQATTGDVRVTRVGRWMRRWSLDELPQLINVLRGEMSLVGPRPHAVIHDDAWGRNIALYARRHNVKPGITGWAQVNGYRGHIESDEALKARIACDLYYIDNWSLWLDLLILALTVFSQKTYRNAV